MTETSTLVRLPELDEEDCSFVLRELELNAFSSVVSAMRAQGVLNGFKECILESLKTAFFIPEEVYQAELRKAANDEFLTKVALILNPSYDTFTPWGMAGRQPEDDKPIFPPPHFFESKETTTSSLALANDLLRLGTSHNDTIAEQDVALAGLLHIKKAPYVPERLRKLLKDTEILPQERVLPHEGEEEKEVVAVPRVPRKKAPKVVPVAKRNKKMRAYGIRDMTFEEPSTSYPIAEKITPPMPASPVQNSPVKSLDTTSALLSKSPPKTDRTGSVDLLPSKEADAMGVKEFISKIQAQIELEQRNGLLADSGRRKRKPRLGTVLKDQFPDCARARPFVFPRFQPDGTKPPRGNPDRVAMKRAATPGPSPVMVPPISPPNALGLQGHDNHLQFHPSSSHDHYAKPMTSTYKENGSCLPMRSLPTPGALPLNHVIAKAAAAGMSSVSPATTPTGVIKRPRVESFTDASKLTSPVDLTQRSTALRKAAFMPPIPVGAAAAAVNKVKVAVAPPAEVHGQAMPTIPNSKPIYPQTTVVTVNRTQNRVFTPTKESTPVINTQIIPQRPIPELHGHDYGTKPPVLVKKIMTPAPLPPIRTFNGVPSAMPVKLPLPIGQNLAPQVRDQVINVVKKIPTPPVALTANSPAPLMTAIHRPSPPPNALTPATVQTLSMKKYHAMGALPSSPQNQSLSVGQFLRKVAPPVSSSSPAETGPPPVKRVFYCDANNPTVATVHTEPVQPIREDQKAPERKVIIIPTEAKPEPPPQMSVPVLASVIERVPDTVRPTVPEPPPAPCIPPNSIPRIGEEPPQNVAQSIMEIT